jgi:type VI secretion system secreted protein Hcp
LAVQAYVKIKGTKQGQFKGEGVQSKIAGTGAIPLVRFSSDATAPRDVATGQASGKRQWQPIRITKEWGAASPQLLQAMTQNEILSNVVFEFYRADPSGKQSLHYRITLQNATVSSVHSYVDLTVPAGTPFGGHELEDLELTFQSIMVEDVADKTTVSDNFHQEVATPQQPQPVPVLREPVRPIAPA